MELHGLASLAIQHRRMTASLCAALLILPGAASAQGTLEDYRRAATISQRFENLTTGLTQGVAWIGRTNQAVYRVSVTGGNRFVKVDAEQWGKQPAFDHVRLAESLSRESGRAYSGTRLPFQNFTFNDALSAIEMTIEGARWTCMLADYSCRTPEVPPPGEIRRGIFTRYLHYRRNRIAIGRRRLRRCRGPEVC